MASGWEAVRDEIRATLEAAPLSLRRVKRGIADLAGVAMAEAGRELFQDGYFITPTTMSHGPYMQLLSTERTRGFEIYTGVNIGYDFDVSFDVLDERVELIIQKMHDCNANVPSAKIVQAAGPVQFIPMQAEPDQYFAVLPFTCSYRM